MAQNVIEVIARGRDFVTPELSKIGKSLSSLKKSIFSLQSAFIALGTGFGAAKLKDLALFTANVDLLRLSMHQLARVNGINTKFLDATVEVMKSMGVATDDAMRSINSFIRLNLDLTKATKFTRVAQDLAVVSQRTTSDVVEQLTRGITTLNARVLRNAGVFFTAQQATEEWAKANNRTVKSMSTAEKQAAVLNKIIEEGEKVTGAYEASLSLAGKKVLQLDRLWKEAKLAVGEFTQKGLMIAVESVQDFLKSIITLKETGRLDEYGKSLSNVLINIINFLTKLKDIAVGTAKVLYNFRNAILLVAEAYIGWRILSSIIRNVTALNAALIALEGEGIFSFLVSVQRLTSEIGLFQAATISAGTALTIFGTALTGIGIGYFLGKMISTSQVMRDLRDSMLSSGLSESTKKFFDDWIFGAIQLEDQLKENQKLQEELIQSEIELRTKKAKKVQEELAKEESARRKVQQAREDFVRTLDDISRAENKNLSATERKLNNIRQLLSRLKSSSEALKTVEPETTLIDEGILKEREQVLLNAETKLQTKLAEEKQKARMEELQRVADHGTSLSEVLSARLEMFVQNAKSSWALFADTVMQIGGLMKSAIDDSIYTLLTGVGSIEQIWTTLWQSMLKSVISAVTGMILQMVLLKVAALLGIGSQLVAETASNAVEVYGNTFASAAAVPGIGWLYAPIAAEENLAAYLAGVPLAFGQGSAIGGGLATLAHGGIVDSPTLSLIGEAGPEAVIPLSGPEAQRRLGGGVTINNLTLELFPNISDGSFLFNIPRTKLEQWTRRELLPVFDSLNERNIRPQRG